MATRFDQPRDTEAQGVVILTSVVEEEGDQFVSFCTELGTASCGDSIEEALANLQEAIWVHLNALEETGERERVFGERGIDLLSSRSTSPYTARSPSAKW